MAAPILTIHESHKIVTETRHVFNGQPYTVDLCEGCGWCVCHYREVLNKPCRHPKKELDG